MFDSSFSKNHGDNMFTKVKIKGKGDMMEDVTKVCPSMVHIFMGMDGVGVVHSY